jgi:molecular chaperone GrpE
VRVCSRNNEEDLLENEEVIDKQEEETPLPAEPETSGERQQAQEGVAELNDKYLRLYAEFENYRKRVQREKDDLVKYSNEDILYHLLPVMDNLEMALKHSADSVSEGLVKGVEITLREFQRVTEKFGLVPIPATGKPFDPSVHHAMSQVERTDMEDKTVVEEFRKGYMLSGKVLRPSLVAVSKRPAHETETKNRIHEHTKEE